MFSIATCTSLFIAWESFNSYASVMFPLTVLSSLSPLHSDPKKGNAKMYAVKTVVDGRRLRGSGGCRRFVTVQDGGASLAVAQASTAPGLLHAVTIATLAQPMCSPVPSLGRPQPAAWRTCTFELTSQADQEALAQPGIQLPPHPPLPLRRPPWGLLSIET